MKSKRILAMIMSVAMLVTSSNFALETQAANETVMPVMISSVSENMVSVASSTNDGGDVTGGDVTDGDVTDGDVTGGDVTGGDVTGGDVTDGDVTDGDAVVEIDNEFFSVTKAGVLVLKDGVELANLKGTLDLPKEAVVIPAGIFSKNTKVTALTVPEDSMLEEIEAGAFEGSAIKVLSIPDAVTEIADETFKDSKLQELKFSSNSELAYIGEEAFAGSNLVKMNMPEQVTEIGDAAFRGCLELQSVALVNVETLGANAFKGCTILNVMAWGNNLTTVGDGAFSASGIQKVELNNTYGANIENWGTGVFEKCEYLSRVVLPYDMKVIPERMFSECTALTYVALPVNCTVIEEEAFMGCSVLSKVTIPANVGIIGNKAFAGCQELDEVIIKQRGNNDLKEADIIMAETAFPEKELTMKGYDGTVEDYADRKGYTYVTLFPSHSIAVDVNNKEYGSASVSAKSARQGEVIKVTVTPAAEYRLKASTFGYNGNIIDTLVEDLGTAKVFSFVMPDEDVNVQVDFEKTTVSYGTLSASFVQTKPDMIYVWDSSKKVLTLDKVGLSAKLVVKSSKGVSYNPGAWLFDYTTKDSKIAVIDSTGVIYARGVGTTTITATMKEDVEKKISFKVTIENEADINNVELEYADMGKAKLSTENIEGTEYDVIQYTKSNLQKSEKNFTVKLHPTASGDNTSLFVNADWKSSNEDIAYPEFSNTSNNENVIRVKKGVTGEAAITVTVTNGRSGKDKVVLHEESFIIRVMDVTPRLMQSSISLNALCTTGVEFDLLSVYGYEVEPAGLMVVSSVKEGTITEYEETPYVTARYKNGSYYMELTKEGKDAVIKNGKDITYKNMYIQGEYTYDTEYGAATEVFRTPIKTLILTKKAPSPTVKVTGKLNLFYNSNADVADRGEVVIKQTVKNVTNASVAAYELVSVANYEKAGSEEIDSFANNFTISPAGVISRSSNELIKDAKGKVVANGYLKITYVGYEPCYVKLTVPTQVKKPTYVLSATKATVNTYSSGYELKLQLLDKSSKKPLSLAYLDALSFDESSSGTTTGLFADMDTEDARESDVITLKVLKAQKGKAVINVEMDTWNEPLKFTFNLSVTNKAPVAKVKSATLTLNNVCVGRAAETTVSLNQADVELIELSEAVFAGSASLEDEAANISFSYEDGVLSAVATDTVKKGSYKFRFTPKIQYTNGVIENLKDITVTVKIVDNKLSASLKPSTVTLNNLYAGRETVSASYTVKNLPAGENVTVLTDGIDIVGANSASEEVKDSFEFTFDENATNIQVTQTQMIRKNSTYKFRISGLKLDVAGAEVEIQPFYLSVKVISSNPKLTVKASGSLNPNNSISAISYGFTLKNTCAKIVDLEIKELNTTNGLNKPYEELVHFKVGNVVRDESGNITSVEIMANDSVTLDAKKTYKLRMGVVLEGGDSADVWTSDIKIAPKQVLPKIKTDVDSATLYAGVAMNDPKRSQEILIIKTTEQSAEIASVGFAKGTSANVAKAFKVTFDPETQKAKVTLLRPDLLKPNTTYTVKLEVRMIGQMVNTTGPQFSVKLKVQN